MFQRKGKFKAGSHLFLIKPLIILRAKNIDYFLQYTRSRRSTKQTNLNFQRSRWIGGWC